MVHAASEVTDVLGHVGEGDGKIVSCLLRGEARAAIVVGIEFGHDDPPGFFCFGMVSICRPFAAAELRSSVIENCQIGPFCHHILPGFP